MLNKSQWYTSPIMEPRSTATSKNFNARILCSDKPHVTSPSATRIQNKTAGSCSPRRLIYSGGLRNQQSSCLARGKRFSKLWQHNIQYSISRFSSPRYKSSEMVQFPRNKLYSQQKYFPQQSVSDGKPNQLLLSNKDNPNTLIKVKVLKIQQSIYAKQFENQRQKNQSSRILRDLLRRKEKRLRYDEYMGNIQRKKDAGFEGDTQFKNGRLQNLNDCQKQAESKEQMFLKCIRKGGRKLINFTKQTATASKKFEDQQLDPWIIPKDERTAPGDIFLD